MDIDMHANGYIIKRAQDEYSTYLYLIKSGTWTVEKATSIYKDSHLGYAEMAGLAMALAYMQIQPVQE